MPVERPSVVNSLLERSVIDQSITVNIVRLVSAFGSVPSYLFERLSQPTECNVSHPHHSLGVYLGGNRLLVRKLKGLLFLLGDYFSMGPSLCALVRLALDHVILIWGTNNTTTTFRDTHHFTTEEIRRREIASKFVLTN